MLSLKRIDWSFVLINFYNCLLFYLIPLTLSTFHKNNRHIIIAKLNGILCNSEKIERVRKIARAQRVQFVEIVHFFLSELYRSPFDFTMIIYCMSVVFYTLRKLKQKFITWKYELYGTIRCELHG